MTEDIVRETVGRDIKAQELRLTAVFQLQMALDLFTSHWAVGSR